MANFALANEMPGQRPASRMRQSSSTLQHSVLASGGSPPKDVEKKPNGDAHTNGIDPERPAKAEPVQSNEDVVMPDANQPDTGPDTKEDVRNEKSQDQQPSASQDTAAISDGDSAPMARGRSSVARPTDSIHVQKTSSSREGESKHVRSGSNNHILKQIASFNRSPIMGRRELPGTEDDSSASDSRPASRAKRVSRPSKRQESRVRSPSPEKEASPPPPPEVEPEAEVLEDEEVVEDPADDTDSPTYCYCGRTSFGTMIACENPDCKGEWFHLECTGLKALPSQNGKLQLIQVRGLGVSC